MAKPLLLVAALAILATALLLPACATTEAAATRPELYQCRRLALFGLHPTEEALFTALFMERFPTHDFVERSELERIFDEQDIHPGRMDEKKRAQMKRVLGVQGMVLASFEGAEKFSLRVVDTETGAVLASVVTKNQSFGLGTSATKKQLISQALDEIGGS